MINKEKNQQCLTNDQLVQTQNFQQIKEDIGDSQILSKLPLIGEQRESKQLIQQFRNQQKISEQIRQIAITYPLMRTMKVDSNTIYRSIFLFYIQLVLKQQSIRPNIDQLIKKIELKQINLLICECDYLPTKLKETLREIETAFISGLKNLCNHLQNQEQKKISSSPNAMIDSQSDRIAALINQLPTFDFSANCFMRSLALSGVQIYKQKFGIFYDGREEMIIKKYSESAQNVIIKILAQVLGIQINILLYDDKESFEYQFNSDHILLKSNETKNVVANSPVALSMQLIFGQGQYYLCYCNTQPEQSMISQCMDNILKIEYSYSGQHRDNNEVQDGNNKLQEGNKTSGQEKGNNYQLFQENQKQKFEIQELKLQINNLNKEIIKMKEQHLLQVQNLEIKQESTVQSIHQNYQEQIEKCNAQIISQKQRIESLESSKDEATSKLIQLNNALQNEVKKQQQTIKEQSESLKNQQGKCNLLEMQNLDLVQQMNQSQLQIADYQQQMLLVDKRKIQLQQQDSNDNEKQNLINQLNIQVAAFKEVNEQLQIRILQSEAQYQDQLAENQQRYNEYLKDLQEQIANLNKIIDQQQVQVMEVNKEKQELVQVLKAKIVQTDIKEVQTDAAQQFNVIISNQNPENTLQLQQLRSNVLYKSQPTKDKSQWLKIEECKSNILRIQFMLQQLLGSQSLVSSQNCSIDAGIMFNYGSYGGENGQDGFAVGGDNQLLQYEQKEIQSREHYQSQLDHYLHNILQQIKNLDQQLHLDLENQLDQEKETINQQLMQKQQQVQLELNQLLAQSQRQTYQQQQQFPTSEEECQNYINTAVSEDYQAPQPIILQQVQEKQQQLQQPSKKRDSFSQQFSLNNDLEQILKASVDDLDQKIDLQPQQIQQQQQQSPIYSQESGNQPIIKQELQIQTGYEDDLQQEDQLRFLNQDYLQKQFPPTPESAQQQIQMQNIGQMKLHLVNQKVQFLEQQLSEKENQLQILFNQCQQQQNFISRMMSKERIKQSKYRMTRSLKEVDFSSEFSEFKLNKKIVGNFYINFFFNRISLNNPLFCNSKYLNYSPKKRFQLQ